MAGPTTNLPYGTSGQSTSDRSKRNSSGTFSESRTNSIGKSRQSDENSSGTSDSSLEIQVILLVGQKELLQHHISTSLVLHYLLFLQDNHGRKFTEVVSVLFKQLSVQEIKESLVYNHTRWKKHGHTTCVLAEKDKKKSFIYSTKARTL